MADTQRSVSEILALLADNTTGAISPQDLRDALVTWRPAHGQLWVADGNGAALGITAASSWVEATAPVWSVSSSDNYLFDESAGNGRLTYTGDATIMAHVAGTISFRAANNNQVTHWRLGLNGTPDAKAEVQTKIGTGTDVQATALHLITVFSTGDYVSLWGYNDTSSAELTLDVANLQLMSMPM